MPSDDPMWVAARFAWLYVTILGFGAVLMGLFALVGVLPAFGSFTGMHPAQTAPGDRVFAVAEDAVRELPT